MRRYADAVAELPARKTKQFTYADETSVSISKATSRYYNAAGDEITCADFTLPAQRLASLRQDWQHTQLGISS
jgi:hypothetical protein